MNSEILDFVRVSIAVLDFSYVSYSDKVILFGGPFILREEKCHLLSDFPDRLDGR